MVMHSQAQNFPVYENLLIVLFYLPTTLVVRIERAVRCVRAFVCVCVCVCVLRVTVSRQK